MTTCFYGTFSHFLSSTLSSDCGGDEVSWAVNSKLIDNLLIKLQLHSPVLFNALHLWKRDASL